MTRKIRRHPDVAEDIFELASFIARDSIESALRFFDEVEAALKTLARMPGIGDPCSTDLAGLDGMRFFSPRRFPNHLIFYRSNEREIYVGAVLQGARDLKSALRHRAGSHDSD